ncbi:hypothetical protein AWB71_04298 [Caballeronia peredens]|nr:hypothetical protein AWB71_04298 [Caballeronia peredens]
MIQTMHLMKKPHKRPQCLMIFLRNRIRVKVHHVIANYSNSAQFLDKPSTVDLKTDVLPTIGFLQQSNCLAKRQIGN